MLSNNLITYDIGTGAVARAFKEDSIIERYGSGIARIQNACKRHGSVEVSFEEFQHGFRITISKKSNEGINEGVKSLYELIKKNPNRKTPFFTKELNTSVKNIERWIKQLKNEDKIEFKGAPKTGGYVVKGSDAQ